MPFLSISACHTSFCPSSAGSKVNSITPTLEGANPFSFVYPQYPVHIASGTNTQLCGNNLFMGFPTRMGSLKGKMPTPAQHSGRKPSVVKPPGATELPNPPGPSVASFLTYIPSWILSLSPPPSILTLGQCFSNFSDQMIVFCT